MSTEIQSKAAVSFIMLGKNEVKCLIKQVIGISFSYSPILFWSFCSVTANDQEFVAM